jgi:Holliday junction resolvase
LSKESLLYPKLKEWILESYPNAWIYRTTDTFRVGIPDLLACINGNMLAIEVKASEEFELSKIQEYELMKIREAGGYAYAAKGETISGHGVEFKWKEVTLKEVLDATNRQV